jgi:hypothetical protein
MPAQRVPTAVLEARGSFGKNPQRLKEREDEPRPKSPLGEPPEEFLNPNSPTAKDHLRAWDDIVRMVPDGVLTSADWAMVELTARTLVLSRRPGSKTSDRNLLKELLGKLGCNPADRTKVRVEREKAVDAQAKTGWGALAEERVQ